MSLVILSSYLAFNIPATRRDVAIGGAAAAVASAFPIPASAGLMFDPIGAYSMGGSSGATNLKPVKADPLRPNSGITLLREVFDGYLPDGGLLKWYEQHLADDFQAVFEGGKVKLDKQAYLAVTADLLKSFPDFTYTRSGPIAYADSPNIVVWTAVVKGTHSGAPYSPLPGVPPVSAKSPPVACRNDPEKITLNFASGSGLQTISRITVEQKLSGGGGYSGPVGFYLQAGGDASKVPQ